MAITPRFGRAVVVLLGVVLASMTVARLAAPVVVGAATDVVAPGTAAAAAVASAVTLVAASVLALVACWVAAATTWCVVSALRAGGAPRSARAHALLRPWLVRVLVGAALGTTALATPAVAASPAPTTPQHSTPTPDAPSAGAGTVSLPRALAGLPLPDRPVETAPAPEPPTEPAPTSAPEPPREPVRPTMPQRRTEHPAEDVAQPAPKDASPAAGASRRTHTVVAGESLWSIAADHLPPAASPAEVDRWWRAVYAANRPGIGDDPDLIRPGTVLRLPRPLA